MKARVWAVAFAVVASFAPPPAHAAARAWSLEGTVRFDRFGWGGIGSARFEGSAVRVGTNGSITIDPIVADLRYDADPLTCPVFWNSGGPFTAGPLSGYLVLQGGLGAGLIARVDVTSPHQYGEGPGTFTWTSPTGNPCLSEVAVASVRAVVPFA